jgi:hypothetical protein
MVCNRLFRLSLRGLHQREDLSKTRGVVAQLPYGFSPYFSIIGMPVVHLLFQSEIILRRFHIPIRRVPTSICTATVRP